MDKVFEIISKPISAFLKKYGINLSDELILIILILFSIISSFIFKKTYSFFSKKFSEYTKLKTLHPFFNFREIKNVKKNYISQKFQNIAPSKEDELIYTNSYVAKQNLIEFLLNSFNHKSDRRFFIVLADSGMGKTTFSLNLYLKYNNIIRHFLNKNNFKIALIPLGYDTADIHIEKLKENQQHHNTILILDALDEDKKAIENNNFRLKEIIELTKDFRFLIITCRTQFFNSEKLEPNETNVPRHGTKKGYYSFEKLYLSPFSDSDIKKFIFKKYGILNYFSNEKKKAYKIIHKSPYLMARPMLLDYIKDLTKTNKEYDFTFEIYESLIDAWLDRETLNVDPKKKFTYKNELLKFSSEISKIIYDSRLQQGYTINLTEFEKIAIRNNLDLTFFEMKTRSLLNRNSSGDYKFSHKSILEYFLAIEIYRNKEFKKRFDEEGMDMTINFYNELCYNNNFKKYLDTDKFKIQIKAVFNKNYNNKIYDFENCLFVKELNVNNYREENIRTLRAFKNITSLVIRDSEIESLDDINCFQNLKSLTIINSKVKEIERISELNLLENLILKNISLYDYEKNNIKWKKLVNIANLDLSDNHLTNFNQINEINGLRTLNLCNNKITNIKVPIFLSSLNISKNKLEEILIPKEGLKNLNISENLLTNIKLVKNNSLVNIDISKNKITKIETDENTKLIDLEISNNLFDDESINTILSFKNLKRLNISCNKIQSINFMKKLDELLTINIENTLIDKSEIDNKILENFTFEKDDHILSRKKL